LDDKTPPQTADGEKVSVRYLFKTWN